jgi:RNA polymerase sigma-70 factor (ECF subfamily)
VLHTTARFNVVLSRSWPLTSPGRAIRIGDSRMSESKRNVTELLRAWNAGDIEARDRATALVYDELRRRAAAQIRRERPGHTLQPTALVHEAYMRLADQRAVWQNRAQFLAVVSRMMRRILVDHARARLASKRSGRWPRVNLADVDAVAGSSMPIDLLDLDLALDRLAAFDARKSRVAELRFFGGLTLDEMGHVLEVSPKTVERDWQMARAWLFKMLSGRPVPRDDA